MVGAAGVCRSHYSNALTNGRYSYCICWYIWMIQYFWILGDFYENFHSTLGWFKIYQSQNPPHEYEICHYTMLEDSKTVLNFSV